MIDTWNGASSALHAVRRSRPSPDDDLRYKHLIDHSPDAIVVHDGQVLVFVNAAGLHLIGAGRAERVVGHHLREFVDDQSMATLAQRVRALERIGDVSTPTEMEVNACDGRSIVVEARSVLTVWDGRPAYLAIVRDLTAEKEAEAAVASAERLFAGVISSLVEGVLVLDGNGTVKLMNTAAAGILGVTAAEVVDATGVDGLAHRLAVMSADGERLDVEDYPHVRTQRTGTATPFVMGVTRPDGRVVWIRGTTTPMGIARDTRMVVSFSDITAERRASALLRYQATHDALTGLPTRVQVMSGLAATLNEPDRGPITVLFIDLDNLKTINDTLGHGVGDLVLRVASARLRAALPAGSVVGRVGGDEFAAVLVADTEDLVAIDHAVHISLGDPIELDDRTIKVAASIGSVQVSPDDPRGVDELLRDADLAMYAAKAHGGGRTVPFTPRLHRDHSRPRAL